MNGKTDGRKQLTGAELIAGGRNFQALAIPEILDPETNEPRIVYLRPLRTSDVLGFVEQMNDKKPRRMTEGTDSAGSGINSMLDLIAKTVCDSEGNPLFTAEDAAKLRELDMRIFTRLSSGITNMMNDRPLDYVAPKEGAQPGNVSSEATLATPAQTTSASPIA